MLHLLQELYIELLKLGRIVYMYLPNLPNTYKRVRNLVTLVTCNKKVMEHSK